jgi:hypothetical protein
VLLGAYVLGPTVFGLIVTLGASFRTAFVVTALATFGALIPLGRIRSAV